MKHEALSFLDTRIGRRFLAILLIISVLPLLIMRWLAIRKSEAAIAEQTTAVLRGASDAAEAQLREFLDHLEENLLQITHDPRVANALNMLTGAQGASSTSAIAQILRTMVPADVDEVFLLDEHGKLHASSAHKSDFIECSGADFYNRGAKDFSPETNSPRGFCKVCATSESISMTLRNNWKTQRC